MDFPHCVKKIYNDFHKKHNAMSYAFLSKKQKHYFGVFELQLACFLLLALTVNVYKYYLLIVHG